MQEEDDNIDESYQIKLANACSNIVAEVGLAPSFGTAAATMRVECATAPALPHERQEEIYNITETNMKAIYIESGWGWRPIEKRNEFFHPLSRVLTLIDEASNQIAGLGIFRFEYDDEEEPEFIVLYIYELQVREAYRRMGYGAQILDAMMKIGRHFRMKKLILTCFKCNTIAMNFYRKEGFQVDKTSPSCYGYDEAYEILSKRT